MSSYDGGRVTLKLITAANPTMSMQEAIHKMKLINDAVDNNMKPLALVGSISSLLGSVVPPPQHQHQQGAFQSSRYQHTPHPHSNTTPYINTRLPLFF